MGRHKKIIEDLKERAGEDSCSSDNNIITFLPSGSSLLDLVLGGGYAVGKIVNIVGDKSSGKTLLAVESIAASKKVYNDKLKIFYDDAESGFSINTKKLYGIDIIDECQNHSITVEDFQYNLSNQLDQIEEDEYLIYILDSLDALSSEAEMERADKLQKAKEEGKTVDGGTYGLEKQKKLGQIFRLFNQKIKDKKCTLIIISQVRSNIGVMFGDKYTRTGGKALDFYASQIIWLAEVEKKKKQDVPVGISTKVKCKKNKVGMPFREAFIEILFDYGVDDITTGIYYLYDLRTPIGKAKLSKIDWDGKTFTPAALVKYIEENNLETELKNRIIKKWFDLEDAISSKERKKKW